MKRLSASIILTLLLSALALTAQNKPPLTIRCNVSGAQVFVNGTLTGVATPALMLRLNPGSYQIRVTATGYQDYNTTVNLPPSGMALTVTLQPGSGGGPTPQPLPQPQPVPQPQYAPPPQAQYAPPPQPTPQPQYAPPPQVLTPPTPPAPPQNDYSFTLAHGGNGQLLRGAARGPDGFVVVGNSGTVLTSTDGRVWSIVSPPAGSTNFTSVRWAGDRFIATGDGGTIHSSPDGRSWAKVNSGSSRHLSSAIYTGERFIVSGQGGTLLGSPDGINFAPLPANQSSNILNLAQGRQGIVATGEDGLILFSSEGLLWSRVNSGVSDKLYGLAYGPAGFVAGGSSQNCPILFSPDGRNWNVVYRSSSAQTFGAVIWDGDRYLVGGSYGQWLESKDGRSWRDLPVRAADKHYSAFATGGGVTIAVEVNGAIYASRSPSPTPPPSRIGVKTPIITPPVTSAGSIPVTLYWHMADDADVYLNGQPIRNYSPDFRTRPDEAPLPAFSASANLKTGDLFTVGTRRGGSWGFMLIAVDQGGRIVWKTDQANWQIYKPVDESSWYRPDVAGNSMKRPVQIQSDPWYPQKDLNGKFGNAAQSIGDPNERHVYLYSIVQLGAGSQSQGPGGYSGSSLGPNLALGKPARQSSTLSAEASKAVDGNTNGLWDGQSVSHTQSERNAWWEVDLGGAYRIKKIIIYNRTDRPWNERLNNFRVLLSEAPFPNGPANASAPGVASQVRAKADDVNEFAFDNRARYVRVQLEGENYLQLAEVQIFSDGAAQAAASSQQVPPGQAKDKQGPQASAQGQANAASQSAAAGGKPGAGIYDVENRPGSYYTLKPDGGFELTEGGSMVNRGTWTGKNDGSLVLMVTGMEIRYVRNSSDFYPRDDSPMGIKRKTMSAVADPAKAGIVGDWFEAQPNGQGVGGGWSFTFNEDGSLSWSEGGRGGGSGGAGTWKVSGPELIVVMGNACVFTPFQGKLTGDDAEGRHTVLKRRP